MVVDPPTLADRAFVGRRNEVEQLGGAVDAAVNGLGSVWLVTGEPGIGESRPLDEVAAIADHRHPGVLWGRCR